MSDVNAIATQRLADEFEIYNLLNRWAMLNDLGDLDGYVACWTEDAQAGVRRAGLSGPGNPHRHVMTTDVIQFDNADSATCELYLLLFIADPTRSPQGTPVTPPVARHLNHVRALLERSPDGWKLKEISRV